MARLKYNAEHTFEGLNKGGSIYENTGSVDPSSEAIFALMDEAFEHGDRPKEVAESLGLPFPDVLTYYQSWDSKQTPTLSKAEEVSITRETLANKGITLVDMVLNALISQAQVAADPVFIRDKTDNAIKLLQSTVELAERLNSGTEGPYNSLPAPATEAEANPIPSAEEFDPLGEDELPRED